MTLIRRAVLDDTEQLATLHGTIFDQHWDAAFWKSCLLNGHDIVWCVDDGALKGLLAARIVSNEAEILTIGILPQLQRHGWGERLLEASMNALAGLGVSSIFLEVAKDNFSALALYEKSGFSKISERKRYYVNGADALVLRKDLH